MKLAALLAVAALFSGAAPAPKMTDHDFEQLMQAAAVASSANSGIPAQTICVQRELEDSLKYSRGAMEAAHITTIPGAPMGKAPAALETAVESAFAAALSPRAAASDRTAISSLPPHFVPYSASAVPARCVIDHRWVSASPSYTITITLTRPVFANGYAFIDDSIECAGLCGSGWLRVFEKRNGKWAQVTYRNLFVS